jgi:hypothetical protein
MKKIIELFNFLTIGAFLSAIILFIGDLFGFSLSLNFHLLWRILAGLLALDVLLNIGNIKKLLKTSTISKKFLLFSGLNLFLFALLLLFYPIFRFGSPFVWEDRIANFKAAKRIEITLNEPLNQSFQAKSNNLGTIGLRIISKDVVIEEEEPEEATTSAELTGNEETGAVQGINIGGELDEELGGELYFGEPERIVFRIKEEEKKDYFYENTYELNQYWETNYFIFGFPVQKDSEDKNYVFEIEKTKEGGTNKVFLIERDSQGRFNFYPRYVYNLASLKTDWDPILLNISRKTNQFLEEKTIQFNLIFVFLLTELFLFFFLKKGDKKFITKLNPYLKYGFLITILLMIVFSMEFEFIKDTSSQNFFDFLSFYNFLLILLTIFFGLLAYCFNKERIGATNLLKITGGQDRKGIKKEFSDDFRRLSNLKSIIKNKNGWGYVLGLIAIILSGIFLRLNNIKHLSIWYDEGISISVAKNIANGLGNTLIDGSTYNRAYLYHKYLSYFFQFSEEFYIGIIANIPFFIISSIFLYFFGKELLSRKAGLFASFLFSFSWVGIAMFRGVRFYEMFVCLFLIGNYFLYKSLKAFFNNDKSLFKNKILTFRLLSYFLALIIFFLFSLHVHQLTYFILYALFAMGIILYFLKSNRYGVLITILSLFLLALGQLYKYKEIRFQLEYNMPNWFSRLQLQSAYFDFMKELTFQGYFYLPIIIGFLIFFMLKENKLAPAFLFSVFFGLYSMISIQGVGEIFFLRYYYFLFPFIFLSTGYVLFSIKNSKIKLSRIIYYLLLIVIIITTLYTGIQESLSPLNKTSKCLDKNLPNKELSQLVHQKKYSEYKVIGSNLFTLVSFLYSGKNITYFLDETNLENAFLRKERHTGIKAISYNQLIDMINRGEKIIFVDNTTRFKIMRYELSDQIKKGKKIFEQKINSKGDKMSVVIFN